MTSPYAPPASRADARPSVIGWFRAYAGAMLVTQVASAIAGGFILASAPPRSDVELVGMLVLFASIAVAALFAVATFVPYQPWGWTMALVAIALGVPSCAIVVAIPLLIHWTRADVKAAFRRL